MLLSEGFIDATAVNPNIFSAVSFFYDSFYERLFEVQPAYRVLFRNSMQVQGKALVRMIDAALKLAVTDSAAFRAALIKLAVDHFERGTLNRGIEYLFCL